MPRQELFFKQQVGNRRIEVVKTYDVVCAREVFADLDEAARTFLWNSLATDEQYEEDEISTIQPHERDDLMWETLIQESREDGNLLSFFLAVHGRIRVGPIEGSPWKAST